MEGMGEVVRTGAGRQAKKRTLGLHSISNFDAIDVDSLPACSVVGHDDVCPLARSKCTRGTSKVISVEAHVGRRGALAIV